MFSLFGNCYTWSKRIPSRNITIAVIGLDNAGKSSTLLNLKKEKCVQTAPTVGFERAVISLGKSNITLYDLGGGSKIRAIWPRYFPDAHGFVYVVDSADINRFTEVRDNLANVISLPTVQGKPLLLLANKQDINGAASSNDICEVFNLESLANQYRCPCRVDECNALGDIKSYPAIRRSLKWLVHTILRDFDALDKRVTADKEEQKEKDRIENENRRERVRKLKEERNAVVKDPSNIDNPKEKAENDAFQTNNLSNGKNVLPPLRTNSSSPINRPLPPLNIPEMSPKRQKKKKKRKKKNQLEPITNEDSICNNLPGQISDTNFKNQSEGELIL